MRWLATAWATITAVRSAVAVVVVAVARARTTPSLLSSTIRSEA